ncbi:hypothetical protein, variant [Plasmodium falciparum MaliPS096_E11]|uniref:Uncharacterized protein n=1 Tax=Plasmodium falciparum MaliPS096_E11 TaxID=1036727 RepID=A0A024WI44_PLAFA|nr:hypothetical protein, variant [Plasmodium falciparum MaliPS096_E11]
MDEILSLKCKVYDELDTCLKCINNLTKNKKLYAQLKKKKHKLDKDTKTKKLYDECTSEKTGSYYTMKDSYISSLLCNEYKLNHILNKSNNKVSDDKHILSYNHHHNKNNNINDINNIKHISKFVNKDNEKTLNNINILNHNNKDPNSGVFLPSDNTESVIYNMNRNRKLCDNNFNVSKHVLYKDSKGTDSTRTNFYDDYSMSYVKSNVDNVEKKEKIKNNINISDKYFLSETDSPYIGKKKALMITLNYNGLLEGCVNDTVDMCDHLMQRFGFNDFILLNDCNLCYRNFVTQKANKKNILSNLHNFIVNSNYGDILFFYFCGYSIKLIDSKFTENYNFALLPQDHSKNNYIYSNEIFNIIKKLQGGKQLCIIFDTTYTSYFVPVPTSITYNKNMNTTEIYKYNNFSSNQKYLKSLKTFGKIRDRNVDSIFVENIKKPLLYEIYKKENDTNTNDKIILVPSIFFFSPDCNDRNDFEFSIKNKVRGLLTYCLGKAIELLKNDFSYHDLFVAASQILIDIKKEYNLKYVKFKLSFLNEYSPDDIKFLSHESLFLKKKLQLDEPLWKPSLKLNNLNQYIQDICNMDERKMLKSSKKKCLLIFIKDIKFYTYKNIDTKNEYFVSCFIKNKNVNILCVRRNNTKEQRIVQDKIFFLEYITLNVTHMENANIYVELFKKKKKNYFVARSIFNIRNVNGKFSLSDEKKNIIGIIDLNIKCVS